MRRLTILLLALAGIAAPALADPIAVNKSFAVVSDPVGSLNPRSIPGAVIDYTVTLSNPGSNAGKQVRNMVFEDPLPANVMLRVSDLNGTGSGPVVFTNGAIVLGIGDSGLTYTFGGLGDQTDSIDFYNGVSWTYTPVPNADGYDPNVRAIRVKPLTMFKTSGSFTLRFRTKLR